MMNENDIKSREDLEKERGPIAYTELQRFFAKGMIIIVSKPLDLIDVALCLQEDNAEQLENWIKQNQVIRAHDDHAKEWLESNAQLTAVTMTPWVLVQENS